MRVGLVKLLLGDRINDCQWEIESEQPNCCPEKYQMSDIETNFIFNVNYLLSLCPDKIAGTPPPA